MEFSELFPVWDKLTSEQKDKIAGSAVLRTAEKGTILHNGSMDCTGLLLIQSGQLRAYIPVSYTHLTLPTKRIV